MLAPVSEMGSAIPSKYLKGYVRLDNNQMLVVMDIEKVVAKRRIKGININFMSIDKNLLNKFTLLYVEDDDVIRLNFLIYYLVFLKSFDRKRWKKD